MRNVPVIILLDFAGHACAGDPRVNQRNVVWDATDHLVDKLAHNTNNILFDRIVKESPFQHLDLDDTALGKPSKLRSSNSHQSLSMHTPRSSVSSFMNPLGEKIRSFPRVLAYALTQQRIAQDLERAISKLSLLKLPFQPTAVGSYSYPGIDGRAKINQDRGSVVYPFAGNPQQALFAVFDGHGERGEKVSEFAMQTLQDTLAKHPGLEGDEAAAFDAAFTTADKQLASLQKMDPDYSGTTAVAALMRKNRVWVANVGDSRCVLASKGVDGKIKTKNLSQDQNPDSPGEQERILQNGGFVRPPPEPDLSARVYLDAQLTQVGLAMSRSIGDHAVKNIGVIANPEVKVYDINGDDQFMILATDGIWEFISSQEAANIVWGVLENGGGASKATQVLIEVAAMRWYEAEGSYRDDITCIVISLPCFKHVSWDCVSSPYSSYASFNSLASSHSSFNSFTPTPSTESTPRNSREPSLVR